MVNEKGELKGFMVVLLFVAGLMILSFANIVNAEDTVFSGTENTVVITMAASDWTSLQAAEMDDDTSYEATVVVNDTSFSGAAISLSSPSEMGGPNGDGKGEPPSNASDGKSGKGQPPAGGPDGKGGEPQTGGKGGEPPVSYLITLSGDGYEGLTRFILGEEMEMPEGMEKPADVPDDMPERATAEVTVNSESLGSMILSQVQEDD